MSYKSESVFKQSIIKNPFGWKGIMSAIFLKICWKSFQIYYHRQTIVRAQLKSFGLKVFDSDGAGSSATGEISPRNWKSKIQCYYYIKFAQPKQLSNHKHQLGTDFRWVTDPRYRFSDSQLSAFMMYLSCSSAQAKSSACQQAYFRQF